MWCWRYWHIKWLFMYDIKHNYWWKYAMILMWNILQTLAEFMVLSIFLSLSLSLPLTLSHSLSHSLSLTLALYKKASLSLSLSLSLFLSLSQSLSLCLSVSHTHFQFSTKNIHTYRQWKAFTINHIWPIMRIEYNSHYIYI